MVLAHPSAETFTSICINAMWLSREVFNIHTSMVVTQMANFQIIKVEVLVKYNVAQSMSICCLPFVGYWRHVSYDTIASWFSGSGPQQTLSILNT
jgi:hypothetical protein